MYIIFFHITGLACIEILFYFYYIGPMENKVFKKTFGSSLSSNTFQSEQSFNYSEFDEYIQNNTQQFTEQVHSGENQRNAHNEKLFHKAIVALFIIFAISISVCILENLLYYNNKKDAIKRNRSSCNVIIEMAQLEESNEEANKEEIDIDIKSYMKEGYKPIIYSCGHVIIMSSLIIGFEYWFFNAIVLKYKIISKEEMEFLILENIESIIKEQIV